MICDAYITTVPENPSKHRQYCYELVKQAMILSGMVPLTIRAPLFHRFLAAEYNGKSEFYVLSDDDTIPMSPDAILNILDRIIKNEKLGIICLAPKKLTTKKELGDRWISEIEAGLHEITYPKGIMIIRRGLLPTNPHEWQDQKINDKNKFNKTISDNEIIADMIRKKGYQVAMDTNNWSYHLGDGYSTLLHDQFITYESLVQFN